jgi:hypothetical protein
VTDILTEVPARQRAGEPRRRWFSSEELDLIVWLDAAARPTAFQLCYGRPRAEHALTWSPDVGYWHTAVDDGERVGLGYKASPILIPDGALDVPALERLLQASGARLPAEISAFVLDRLRGHPAYRAEGRV